MYDSSNVTQVCLVYEITVYFCLWFCDLNIRDIVLLYFLFLLQRIGYKRGGHRQQDRAGYGEYFYYPISIY